MLLQPRGAQSASPPPAIAETPDFNKSDAAMICFSISCMKCLESDTSSRESIVVLFVKSTFLIS